jgi:hypothetical protein
MIRFAARDRNYFRQSRRIFAVAKCLTGSQGGARTKLEHERKAAFPKLF